MRLSKRRLAGVRRARDRHHQTVAQPLAARGAGQRLGDLVAQAAQQSSAGRDQILRHVGFVGEIDPRLDQRQRLDQPRAPAFGAVAEQAFHLPERLAALRLGLGTDQIGQAFDRGEIELAVLERAAGELAGLRRPQPLDPAERSQHRGDHRAAAVQLQLGRVLAGLAVRPGKPQRQRLVDHLTAYADRARGRAPPGAARGGGRSAPCSASPARGPEMRTTAIAAGGRPEERAKMVSFADVHTAG